ncbi:hypothetical protein DYB32_006692 [Aphanomyces invadans]|uniref:EF-hand domain-containing protein n=1 Tax=Aphanomyces invadans TaxID=157072 RepID=A0A3R7CXR2_9STRA|nr:hypothetical protein DYB32_006692 [Aphanomyces invadans]
MLGHQSRIATVRIFLLSMATAVEQARVIFDCVDTSKDGVIDQSELGKLLEALGEDPTPQNIVRALFQLDTGGDGTISFDEFVSFYKLNYLPQHPTKLLTSRHGATAIGHSKSASYTLPPPTFCFGKALQRDKENAGQGTARSAISSSNNIVPKQKLSQQLQGGASALTFSAFKALVVETLHLSATEKDLRAVFGVFDANGDGTIQASEWVAALETPLEGNRLELVAHAFATLDPSHTGYVNLSTLRRQFDGSSLTEVVSGVRTIDEVRNEFLAAMANLSPTTSISWTHFAKHYTHVSSSIADDAAFTKAVSTSYTKLSLQAFKDVMKHSVGVVLSDKDWRVIFEWFAVDNALDLRHVAKQLHSPLSATRLGMVRRAYRSLDVDKCGQVPQMDLLDRFDPAQHPSVVSGKATAVEATDLLKTVLPGPFVTAAQFEAYYGCVSQGIADDAVFEQHVTPLWASRFDDVRSEGGRSSSVSSIAKVGADDQAVGCIKKTPLELYHDSQQQLAAKSAAGKKPRPLTAAREKPKKLAQANKSNVEVDGSSPEQKHQPTSTKNRRVNSTSSRPSVIAAVSTAASVKKSKPTAANAKRKLQRVQS